MAFDGIRTAHSFSNWADVLRIADIPAAVKSDFKREIVLFLAHCRRLHAPASVELARHYLEHVPVRRDQARQALRWWFRQAAHTAPRPAAEPLRRLEPPLARDDLGGADWERDLIAAVRRKGLLWRTETAYRAWARKFAEHLSPRGPYAATAEDIAAFLSNLAVRERASPATQKQALNALVFFVQEALKRQLAPIHFQRARPKRRMPVVLSVDECQRLFAKLPGTTRLMAELAYGAGLRLLELLRLRVQDLDLARGRLVVRAGKGDKDRVKGFAHAVPDRANSHALCIFASFHDGLRFVYRL